MNNCSNHELIFVPHWVKEKLGRNNKQLNTLLSFKDAAAIFSVRDLAGLLWLQTFAPTTIGGNDCAQFPLEDSLYKHWAMGFKRDGSGEIMSGDLEVMLRTVETMSLTKEVYDDISQRLFPNVDETSDCKQSYDIIAADTGLSYVIIKPGVLSEHSQLASSKTSNRLCVLESVLQSFYRSMRTDEVSLVPWFKVYIKELKKSLI